MKPSLNLSPEDRIAYADIIDPVTGDIVLDADHDWVLPEPLSKLRVLRQRETVEVLGIKAALAVVRDALAAGEAKVSVEQVPG